MRFQFENVKLLGSAFWGNGHQLVFQMLHLRSSSQFLAWERQTEMVQVSDLLPSACETEMKPPAPSFGLAQHWLLWPSAE